MTSPNNRQLQLAAGAFLEAFEQVFDADWQYTQAQLGIDVAQQAKNADELLRLLQENPATSASLPPGPDTFLRPHDDIADQDWGNYELLLSTYAELKRVLASPADEPSPTEGTLPPVATGAGSRKFFLNVDLDVETDADLTPLIQALEPYADSLERPPGRASFELNSVARSKAPEPIIVEFVRLVKGLPLPAREVWNGAARRVFDVGLRSGLAPFSESHQLSTATLLEVASVQAEIAFTMYAVLPKTFPSLR